MNLQVDEAGVQGSAVGTEKPRSGKKGVCWDKNKKKWQAEYYANGVSEHLGTFKELADAVSARIEAEKRYGLPVHMSQRRKKYFTEQDRRIARNKQAREWSAQNPQKVAERARSHLGKMRREKPNKAIWARVRDRAKKNNISFNLIPEDIVIPAHCECCRKVMKLFKGGPDRNDTVSVDRILPNKGYIAGNIKLICFRCNWLKLNCTDPEELQVVVNYMRRNLCITTNTR